MTPSPHAIALDPGATRRRQLGAYLRDAGKLNEEEIAKIAASHKLSSLAELAAYEREIIRAMKDRQDYFRDGSLSQPG